MNQLFSYIFVLTAAVFSLQSNKALSTQLVALETEKAELLQSLSAVEAELVVQGEELQRVQSHLVTETESRVKTAEALQNQLNEKVPKSGTIEMDNIPTFKEVYLHSNSITLPTGEQGAGTGEPDGGSSLVLSSWSCGRGTEDDSGCLSSNR